MNADKLIISEPYKHNILLAALTFIVTILGIAWAGSAKIQKNQDLAVHNKNGIKCLENRIDKRFDRLETKLDRIIEGIR